MTDTLLQQLFAKYLDETITPEEFSQLYAMIQPGYDRESLDELLEGAFANPAFAAITGKEERKEAFASLLARITEKQLPQAQPAPVVPLYRRGRWTAAAAAMVLLLVVGYWFSQRPARAAPVLAAKKAVPFDAPPGMDGAVLTLPNGKQVDMDSTCNGSLEDEGDVSLQKQGEQLRCKPVVAGAGIIASSYNVMTTARGKQFQLVLSDGSRVWLNASTSIRFPTAFAAKERRVEVSGEAYFEVIHDKNRPFVVQAGKSSIEVLGTHFDVTDYKDEKNTSATLLEGSIRLTSNGQQLLLAPGEQGRVDRGTAQLSSDQVDADQVIAWTKGGMAIGSSDFAGLMRQISRWYDVDVEFQGAVPNLHIGGFIRRDVNLSIVLDFLGKNGVHYKTAGRTITILP